MRSLRSLATGTLLAVAVLGVGASAALAALAQTERTTFADDWCFDDVTLVYCTVSRGSLTVTITPDGVDRAVIHYREQVVVTDPSGVEVGRYAVVSQSVSTYGPDRQTMQDVSHVRAVGDGLRCVSQSVLRIADFEVTVDHVRFHCA